MCVPALLSDFFRADAAFEIRCRSIILFLSIMHIILFLNISITFLTLLSSGKVGGWKDNFTVAESEFFDKIYKEKMEGSGIEFEFEL